MLEKFVQKSLGKRIERLGRILVYGVGTVPSSECSSNSEPESDEGEPLRGYDFNEEALFDELLAMQVRLGTIFALKKVEKSMNKEKMEGQGESKSSPSHSSILRDSTRPSTKRQQKTLRRYASFTEKFPNMRALIESATTSPV